MDPFSLQLKLLALLFTSMYAEEAEEGVPWMLCATVHLSVLCVQAFTFTPLLSLHCLCPQADLGPGEGADVVMARLDRIARSTRLQPSTSSSSSSTPAAAKSSNGQQSGQSNGSGAQAGAGWWYEDPQVGWGEKGAGGCTQV
jgi:hypothetical protein